jgi:hypothetical protein
MNGPYYHLNGTTDWLKTAVKTVITYNGPHEAVFVESIAARRAQRKYYVRTMLKIQHEMWADSTKTGKAAEIPFFDREDVVCDGGRGISLMANMAELSEYMERFEFFKLSDTLKVLEANLLAYNLMCAGGYDG